MGEVRPAHGGARPPQHHQGKCYARRGDNTLDFVDWLKFGLALIVGGVGLILLAAWAIFRIVNAEEDR